LERWCLAITIATAALMSVKASRLFLFPKEKGEVENAYYCDSFGNPRLRIGDMMRRICKM
jgi:hypothetical protein